LHPADGRAMRARLLAAIPLTARRFRLHLGLRVRPDADFLEIFRVRSHRTSERSKSVLIMGTGRHETRIDISPMIALTRESTVNRGMNPIWYEEVALSIQETIEAKLRRAFSPERLEIINESHLHAGHHHTVSGHEEVFDGAGETHFRVRIVAEAF